MLAVSGRYQYVLVDEFQDTNGRSTCWRACWPQDTATSAWSATPTSRSTAGARPTSAISSTSSAITPSADGHARAELPLDPDHSGRAQSIIAPNEGRKHKDALDRERAGRPDRPLRGLRRTGRGAVVASAVNRLRLQLAAVPAMSPSCTAPTPSPAPWKSLCARTACRTAGRRHPFYTPRNQGRARPTCARSNPFDTVSL